MRRLRRFDLRKLLGWLLFLDLGVELVRKVGGVSFSFVFSWI
jgi:hypothetical protein